MTTSPLKVEDSSSAKVRIAIQALSDFFAMRDKWIQLGREFIIPSYKASCTSRANKLACRGLVMHDRILTGKRPL